MELDIDIGSDLLSSERGYDLGIERQQSVGMDWVFSSIHDAPQQLPRPEDSIRVPKRKRCMASEESGTYSEYDNSSSGESTWTTDHSSVGKKVASFFEVSGSMRMFIGQVSSFLPASSSGSGDQLYRVVYEDDDSEDFDQEEYDSGRKSFQAAFLEK